MLSRLQSSSYVNYKNWLRLQQTASLLQCNELNHAGAVGSCVHTKYSIDSKGHNLHSSTELTQNWMTMMDADVDPSRIRLNRGVRHGLSTLLNAYRDRKWAIAADVYPVHQMLASEASCSFSEYDHMFVDKPFDISTVTGNSAGTDKAADILLVTDPTPLGKSLTGSDIGKILRWVESKEQQHSRRRVVIDAVYSTHMRREVKRLLETERVYFLHSLSKTHALPQHFGVVVGPLPDASAADNCRALELLIQEEASLRASTESAERLNKASFYLATYPTLGKELQQLYASCWESLKATAPELFEERRILPADNLSYLKAVRVGFKELLQQGILAVPSSIYDSPCSTHPPSAEPSGDVSVLSILSMLPMVLQQNTANNANSGDDDPECSPNQEHFTRTMYHVTRLSNFCKGFDKYTSQFSKASIPQSTFSDKFHLLYLHELSIGVDKVTSSCRREGTTCDRPIVIETRVKERTYRSASGVARYIDRNYVVVNRVGVLSQEAVEGASSDNDGAAAASSADRNVGTGAGQIQWLTVEDTYAKSLKLHADKIQAYPQLRPRSVSVLPVAQGCQAKCPFCFSHSSISDDVNGRKLSMERIDAVLDEAKRRGAERAVVTGGGEPLVTPLPRVLQILRSCAARFPNAVTMITNGYAVGKIESISERLQYLRVMRDNGLSVLSISRHGTDAENNTAIMHLDTQSERVAEAFLQLQKQENASSAPSSDSASANHLKLRWVCVLQKGGVDSELQLRKYLNWVASTGVGEICFKELYVSSSEESLYHDYASNNWSREHQIPLNMLTTFLDRAGGVIVDRLPWGSPIYAIKWEGVDMKIAAYTEPTVYWERTNGLCRSWNLLADGDCFASLETKDSQVCCDV